MDLPRARWPLRSAVACIQVVLLAACAAPSARFEMNRAGADANQVWPPPPESARYAFAGTLEGEANYVRQGGKRESAGTRLWRWLTGAEGEPAPERALLRPQGGLVDSAGRVLVADVGRQAVFVFDPRAQDLAVWDRADGRRRFVTPLSLVRGPGEEVWVSDADLARVVRLDGRGQPLGSFGEGSLRRPTGLARDARSGLTFVADTAAHDIKVFDDQGRQVRTLGRRGLAPGEFNAPTFLALDGERLLVSDTLNARVQILSFTGEPLGSIGQRGLYVGNLTRPKGVSVDRQGHVYVVESYYDHLLVFDRDGRLLLPIGGAGTAPGKFFLPGGVWTDETDRVFVSDVFNARVAVFRYLEGTP